MKVGQTYRPYQLFVGSIIPNWLMRRSEISFGAKVLFARLAQYKGESGQCYPSQETLAAELGTTDRNIRNIMQELVDYYLIRKIQRGMNQSNMYEFIWHSWAEDAASEPERKDSSSPVRNDSSVPGWKDSSDKENHTKENHIKENQKERECVTGPEHTPSALPPRNTGNAANAYIPTLDECKDYATNPACGFPPTLVEEWYDRQCDRGWGNDWRARMRASSATYRTIYAERKTFKRKTDYDVNAKPADQKKQPPKSSWQLQEEQWQREKEEMMERAQQRRQANGAQHHTHT